MDDPSKTFGLTDPQHLKAANDILQFMDTAAAQAAIARARKQQAVAAQRDQALNAIEAEYQSLPEELRSYPYPAIRQDFQAQRHEILFQTKLQDLNPNDPAFENKLKALKEEFPAETRKPFIHTELYKQVEKDNADNKERVTMANNLYDQLTRMKVALDAGDRELAASIGKTGVMKSINSLQGKDAVSASEQSTRYQDLLSLPDIYIQSEVGQSMLKQFLSRMAMAKQSGDTNEYQSAMQKFNALVEKSIEAHPDKFYKTAYQLHNAAADTADRLVDRVIRASSPLHAQRYLQAEKPLRLPSDTITLSSQQPNPYAAGMPTAGGSAASKGAPASAAPAAPAAPASAPAQQPAAVPQLTPEQMIELQAEIKRRKGGK